MISQQLRSARRHTQAEGYARSWEWERERERVRCPVGATQNRG